VHQSPNKSLQRSGGRWYLVCKSQAVLDKLPTISFGEPPGAELSRWATQKDQCMKSKRKTLLTTALAFVAMLCACATASSKEQSWKFVESVGGLEIGAPVQVDRRWHLPVRADVSGLHAITHAPTTMNSGLVCNSSKARVKGTDIFLVIVTTLPHDGAKAACPSANLGSIVPGQYSVFYGTDRVGGVKLGSIDIPSTSR